MPHEETPTNHESFYTNMQSSMQSFYDLSLSDIGEEDLTLAYPIQTELKQLFLRYKDAKLIGSGGIKEIYKVRDLKADNTVAMAKLKKEAGRESVESFLREARLTACLQHPNIISIYDLGFDENESPYFTMELLSGKNLHQIIKNNTLSKSQLIDIFNKICDAVSYAHSRQIIHLDLKPDNIQVGEFGEVHLCDWGLAKIITDEDELQIDEDLDPNILNHATINGRIKGSPGYMAPEQAVAYGNKDKRTDTYALGAILYTIFTGESPIQGETIDTLLEKTKEAKITPISDFPNIPKSIQAIIGKSLSKNPDERYQNVHEIKRDLEKFTSGFATEAENAGFLTQLQLLVLRNTKSIAVILLIIAIIGITIFTSFQRIENERFGAVRAKNEALKQKKIAENNFDLLLKEQQLSESLRNETSELLREITNSEDLSSAQRKINLLLEGIKREKNQKVKDAMLSKTALLYFVIQKWNEAKETFDKCVKVKTYNRIYDAATWASKHLGSQTKSSDKDIAEVLSRINHFGNLEIMKALYAKHVKFYRDESNTPEDYLSIASIMLNALNNMWDKERQTQALTYKDGVLKLAQQPYQTFLIKDYELNIFAPLPLTELDLSYTSFFEYFQIRDLRLKKLNIAGCNANTFNHQRLQILQKMGVTQVVSDSRYMTPKEISILKENFEFTDLAPK
ncbi:MAG: serine/threonine protein kinase [Lentisphaeraceae bacterium]|nr:serine/threonine protein kinase [Lentisphaeraceae bacterium]